MIGRVVLLAVLSAPNLTRLPTAGGGEITVQADHFRYNFPSHRVEYKGNPVRLVRGDATLTCKRLGVQLNEAEQVSKATCEDAVRFERGEKVVTCQKATYEEALSRLTCEGDPEVRSGGLTAKGSLLVYDLAADEVTMTDVQGKVPSDDADAKVKEYQARKKPGAAEGHP